MALAGVHISFSSSSSGAINNSKLSSDPTVALLGRVLLSQTMASAGTSSISVPKGVNGDYLIVASLSSSAPIFYAVGATPDATNGPRRYYDGTVREDFFVGPGDKIDWILA